MLLYAVLCMCRTIVDPQPLVVQRARLWCYPGTNGGVNSDAVMSCPICVFNAHVHWLKE